MDEVHVEQPQPGVGDLVTRLLEQTGELFRKELELAKVETRAEVRKAANAGKLLGIGAGIGILAIFMLSFAAAWGLDAVMPTGWAFFIVAVVEGIVAAIVLLAGRRRVETIDLRPEQTVDTLREDVAWARSQRS